MIAVNDETGERLWWDGVSSAWQPVQVAINDQTGERLWLDPDRNQWSPFETQAQPQPLATPEPMAPMAPAAPQDPSLLEQFSSGLQDIAGTVPSPTDLGMGIGASLAEALKGLKGILPGAKVPAGLGEGPELQPLLGQIGGELAPSQARAAVQAGDGTLPPTITPEAATERELTGDIEAGTGQGADVLGEILASAAQGAVVPFAGAGRYLEGMSKGITPEALSEALRRVQPVPGAIAKAATAAAGPEAAKEPLPGVDLGMEDALKAVQTWTPERIKRYQQATGEQPPHTAIAGGLGSMASFMIPGIGVARGIEGLNVARRIAQWAGAGAMGALEGMSEAGLVYDELIAKGASEAEAAKMANKVLTVNAGWNTLLNRAGIFGDYGTFLKRALISSPLEATQESGQQLTSNVATGRPLKEGVKESAQVGAMVGLIGGGAGHPYVPKPTTAEEEQAALGEAFAKAIRKAEIDPAAMDAAVRARMAPEPGIGSPKQKIEDEGVEVGERWPQQYAPGQTKAPQPKPEEGKQDAQQDQEAGPVYGDVRGPQEPEEGAGQVPTEEGRAGVPPGRPTGRPDEESVEAQTPGPPKVEGRPTKTPVWGEGYTELEYFDETGKQVGTARLQGNVVDDIAVSPSLRRQGYGRAIMADLATRGATEAIPGTAAGDALLRGIGSTRDESGYGYRLPGAPPTPKPEAPTPQPEQQPEQPFAPTHELADGTQVVSAGQPDVWLDAEGVEIEDSNATPIEAAENKPPPAEPPTSPKAPLSEGTAAGRTIKRKVMVAETGRTVTIEQDAAEALADIEAKEKAYNRLLDCVRRR